MMKSNPNQMQQVKHESEFRVSPLQPPPTPLLLFLSMAWVQGCSFSMVATEQGLPGKRRAGALVHL